MNPSTPRVSQSAHSGLRMLLTTIARQRLLLALVIVLVPAVAYGLSKGQEKRYEASAEVLLNRQNLANALTGTPDPSAPSGSATFVQTQSMVAASPNVARKALQRAERTDRTPSEFLDNVEVEPSPDSDILVFTVDDPDPEVAVQLANAYAASYADYRRELDTAPLTKAERGLQQRLDSIQPKEGSLYEQLQDEQQKIQTLQALQTGNATVTGPATEAFLTQPRTARNVVLGFVLGTLLGLGLAFGRQSLDNRVRSADELSSALDLPLLGRIPPPPKGGSGRTQLEMLRDPHGVGAEPFRLLRTNLSFASLDRPLRSILVTSAAPAEGKSMLMANLALTYARAGESVVLVDLDLRRPSVHRLFDEPQVPGLTDVVLRRTPLPGALRAVSIDNADAGAPQNGGSSSAKHGSLWVLTAGIAPPDPGELVGTDVLGRMLQYLEQTYDVVLIDAPPLLAVGDGMTLSAKVDAMLIVGRLGIVRRPLLKDLHRLLGAVPARVVGVVATGTDEDAASYDYDYGYTNHAEDAGGQPQRQPVGKS